MVSRLVPEPSGPDLHEHRWRAALPRRLEFADAQPVRLSRGIPLYDVIGFRARWDRGS